MNTTTMKTISTEQILRKHLYLTNPELSLTSEKIEDILFAESCLGKPPAIWTSLVNRLIRDVGKLEDGEYDSVHRYAKLIKLAQYVSEPITYADVVLAKYEDFLKNARGTYGPLENELKEKINIIEKELYGQ